MELMTLIATVAGALLSLLFAYVPGLKEKFGALEDDQKRLVMLGLLVITALALVGVTCGGFAEDLGLVLTCDRSGFVAVLKAFAAATIANQTAFLISPKGKKKSSPDLVQ